MERLRGRAGRGRRDSGGMKDLRPNEKSGAEWKASCSGRQMLRLLDCSSKWVSLFYLFIFLNHFQINRCEGSKGKCSTELFLKSSYVTVPICLTMIRMGGKAIFPVVGESESGKVWSPRAGGCWQTEMLQLGRELYSVTTSEFYVSQNSNSSASHEIRLAVWAGGTQ